MRENIKKLLYRTLGLNSYLKMLHKGFYFLYKSGSLKNDYVYKYHYFVKELIRPDDIVLDIGANLGYYTHIFSDLLNGNGKVVAVEPVKPFYEVIVNELGKRKNVEVHNNALGTEEKDITLTIPNNFGYIRTGLPSVNENNEKLENAFVFNSRMTKASKLFATLPKINFIKCDIEGYEEFVIPEMITLIKKNRPIILMETWGTHKEVTFNVLMDAGYKPYILYKGKLTDKLEEVLEGGDFLFFHQDNEKEILDSLRNKGFL